jgi:hypothetical protein
MANDGAALRVVRGEPVASVYSCRGVEPYGVIRSRQFVPGTGILVRVELPGWLEDPRGHCGACPACATVLAPDGQFWVTVLMVRE